MTTLPMRQGAEHDPAQVETFLKEAIIPLRLAANGKDGFPVVASHWFLYDEGKLYCAIYEQSHMAGLLSDNPSVGFEIAPEKPPYKGVRGAGQAKLSREGAADLLEKLLLRYLGSSDTQLGQWLLSRADREWVVEITPLRISAWDYSSRMT